MGLFQKLHVYRDAEDRSAPLNMSIDEALLETARVPAIRFYRWAHPALSFGYFGRFEDVANQETKRELVRRWTGGGIVLHGADLTYSLVVPANDDVFTYSARQIYSEVHAAIRSAFLENGSCARLAEMAAPKISEACFANPVRADVLVNDKKVAGAAQRRTRNGLLQQGSIQHPNLPDHFIEQLLRWLSPRAGHHELADVVLERAQEIATQKYGTREWLYRR